MGRTPIVEPSLSNIDLVGMRKDIPQYFPSMPPSAVEHWKETLINLEGCLLETPDDLEWPLDLLRDFRRPASQDPDDQEGTEGLELLRKRELAPVPEVSISLLCHSRQQYFWIVVTKY